MTLDGEKRGNGREEDKGREMDEGQYLLRRLANGVDAFKTQIGMVTGCRMVTSLQLLLTLVLCVHLGLGANSAIECRTGDTVTLPCHGRPLNDTEELQWMFQGKPASLYRGGCWCETGHYINRTWLGSIQQKNWSLIITDIREEDEGSYACRDGGRTDDVENIRLIILNAETHWEQREAGTQQGDRPVCRPYREREDPPGASSGGSRGTLSPLWYLWWLWCLRYLWCLWWLQC